MRLSRAGGQHSTPREAPTTIPSVPRWIVGLAVLLALAACTAPQATAPASAPARSTPGPTPAVYLTQSGKDQVAGDYFAIGSAAVAVDYRATGSCLFSFRLFAEATTDNNVDTPRLKPSGPEVSGTWHLTVKPGRYALGGGGDGCSWSVTVREDR
jgi:hypothetical protein